MYIYLYKFTSKNNHVNDISSSYESLSIIFICMFLTLDLA